MSHEHLSNPEQQRASWEDLLLRVVERRAISSPLSDPSQVSDCNRVFRAPSGNFLTLTGHNDGEHWNWSINVSPSKDKVYAVSWQGEVTLPPDPDENFSFDIRPQDGVNRVFAHGSEDPIDPDSVETLVETVINSTPVLEATYHYRAASEQS